MYEFNLYININIFNFSILRYNKVIHCLYNVNVKQRKCIMK